MLCPKCRQSVLYGAKFCNNCGVQLEESLSHQALNQQETKNGIVFIVLGWVFFALSFIIIPILFGAGAFIMGFLVKRSGRDTHGVIMMILAVAGAIFGSLIGFVITSIIGGR